MGGARISYRETTGMLEEKIMFISEVIDRVKDKYQRLASTHLGCRTTAIQPKHPLVSFTFDDFPTSALHGGNILKRHGVSGTYYVSLGLMGHEIPAGQAFSADDLRRVVDDGHELGCHTFDHCHAWETDPAVFEESILANRRALQNIHKDWIFKTLSYPKAYPRPETKRKAAKYFSCCRGGGQTYNSGETDRNSLHSCFLEKCDSDLGLVKEMIQENAQLRGWLIFSTHDIKEKPSPFGCTPQFFEKIVEWTVNSDSKVLPVAKAWEENRGSAESTRLSRT